MHSTHSPEFDFFFKSETRTVYLIHLFAPVGGRASHYIGSTDNLPRRLQEHRRKKKRGGSPLLRAANQQRIHLAGQPGIRKVSQIQKTRETVLPHLFGRAVLTDERNDMHLQQCTVTVKLGCTQNVGDYSNIRPEIELSLTSDIADLADATDLLSDAYHRAKAQLRFIVDDELQTRGKPPLYLTEPCYILVKGGAEYAIVPAAAEKLPPYWEAVVGFDHGYYLDYLQAKIRRRFEACEIPDAALTPVRRQNLPALNPATEILVAAPGARYLLLVSGNHRTPENLPPAFEVWYDQRETTRLIVGQDDEELRRIAWYDADSRNRRLIDCLTMDASELPALPAPSAAIDDEDDIDDDDVDVDDPLA